LGDAERVWGIAENDLGLAENVLALAEMFWGMPKRFWRTKIMVKLLISGDLVGHNVRRYSAPTLALGSIVNTTLTGVFSFYG